MSQGNERGATDPRAGLCATCIYAQYVPSSRGSAFWLCGRAATEPAFPKYPQLPVVECRGYEMNRHGDNG